MSDLPNGIGDFLEYLAEMAAGYDNHLKWNEVAKLKADLMNERHRWSGVSVQTITSRCLELGMRQEDVQEIKELVVKAQSGRNLIPHRSYRDYRFRHVEPPTMKDLETSRIW